VGKAREGRRVTRWSIRPPRLLGRLPLRRLALAKLARQAVSDRLVPARGRRARREFWERANAVAESGVPVLVTTHFMDEAN